VLFCDVFSKRKKKSSSSWRHVFSRGRSISMKDESYDADSKRPEASKWT